MKIDLNSNIFNGFFSTTNDPGPKPIIYGDYFSPKNNLTHESDLIIQQIAGWMPIYGRWKNNVSGPGCGVDKYSTSEATAKAHGMGVDLTRVWNQKLGNVLSKLVIKVKNNGRPVLAELEAVTEATDEVKFQIEPGNNETAWYVTRWEYKKVEVRDLGNFFASASGKYSDVNENVAVLKEDSELIMETVTWENALGGKILTILAWPKY